MSEELMERIKETETRLNKVKLEISNLSYCLNLDKTSAVDDRFSQVSTRLLSELERLTKIQSENYGQLLKLYGGNRNEQDYRN